MPTLAKIHEALISLRTTQPEQNYGICTNLVTLTHTSWMSELVTALASTWPDAHAEARYPVGGFMEYQETKLWENPRRFQLLEHCIEWTKSGSKFPWSEFEYLLIAQGLELEHINKIFKEF